MRKWDWFIVATLAMTAIACSDQIVTQNKWNECYHKALTECSNVDGKDYEGCRVQHRNNCYYGIMGSENG